MTPKQTSAKQHRSAAFSVSMLLILAVFGAAFWQRNALYDWWQLRDYTPPTAIAQLATDTTMTDYARHMYYVNRPELKSRNTFSQYCPSGTEQSVVLGCYKGGQRGIYLLRVDNAELAGIEQVTAAHEMLHAAYERLSAKDRQTVDAELQDYYQTKLTDETIKKTIDEYKLTEPNDLTNEMHSIFGTQITDLPTDLQTYYKQYFTDRSKVTGYYSAYEEAFTSRQAQIKQDDTQLNIWKTEIDSLESTVESQQKSLQAQKTALDRSKASGNVEDYNAGVDAYNASVRAYNANVQRLQSLISQYNQLVNDRNAIAFQQRSLMQSLSSTTVTQ
jgi:hypothetical protein